MDDKLFLKETNYKNDDFDLFLESREENSKCAKALNDAINKNFDGFHLETDEVISSVIEQGYSPERIAYILAVRVYDNDGFDKRFSKSNEDWSKELLADVPDMYKDKWDNTNDLRHELNSYLCTHNGLADMVMSKFRKLYPDVTLVADEKFIENSEPDR